MLVLFKKYFIDSPLPPDPSSRRTLAGGGSFTASFVITLWPFLIFCIIAAALFANQSTGFLQKGNQHYQAGEYQQAAEAYENILRMGQESWQVYYNLGNSYYKLRQPGKAILNYERARRLRPDHEDILFNLDLANLQVADRIPEPPRSAVLIWLDSVLQFFSLEASAALALISWVMLFAGLMMTMMSRKARGQQWSRTLAWTAGVLFLVFASLFAYEYYHDRTTSHGIVMAPRVIVRSSPSEDATEVFILHEGAKARLEARTGDWRRIRLADGKVGWLPAHAVEKI